MINTKDFDWESELASEVIDIIFNREAGWTEKLDDTIAIYRKKAIQADRQQLLKAVEEKMAALHNSEQDGEIPNAKIEVFREVIDLLKAKDKCNHTGNIERVEGGHMADIMCQFCIKDGRFKEEEETLTVQARTPYKNCPKCLAYYKDEHTCPPWIKSIKALNG